MPRAATLPFQFERSNSVIDGSTVMSTMDTVFGLLRLNGPQLSVQWRLTQTVSTVGAVIREDSDVAPIRETTVPIDGLAATLVEPRWWQLRTATRLVLTAPDLRRLEAISGPDGLKLEHPAQLTLNIRSADRLAAQEFVAELELAVAEVGSLAALLPAADRLSLQDNHRGRDHRATDPDARPDLLAEHKA